MSGWLVLGLIYATTVLFAVMMTHAEGRRQSPPALGHRILGYGLCTIWPFVVLAMLVQMHLQVPDPRARARDALNARAD